MQLMIMAMSGSEGLPAAVAGSGRNRWRVYLLWPVNADNRAVVASLGANEAVLSDTVNVADAVCTADQVLCSR